jgi:hypothetical protein
MVQSSGKFVGKQTTKLNFSILFTVIISMITLLFCYNILYGAKIM